MFRAALISAFGAKRAETTLLDVKMKQFMLCRECWGEKKGQCAVSGLDLLGHEDDDN